MAFKPKFTPYNHGVLYVCRYEEEQSSFNASRNPTRKTQLKKVYKLDFEEKSRREQDMDFAEAQGRSLNLKVKTRLRESLRKTDPVTIGDMLYEILHIDYDRAAQEMYLYLEEVRRLK